MPVAHLISSDIGAVIGPRFATRMSRLLRDEFVPPADAPIPEGPHFVYGQNPRLFLGRRGRGPLRIAWDTNLLIDYFEHGRALWNGESLPDVVEGEHGDELEGLQLLVAMWILRDIRFYILSRTLRDARRALAESRAQQRARAFGEFTAALRLVGDEDEARELPPLTLPAAELGRALQQAPPGNDRGLLEEAARDGMHVFMTRDAGILKARAAMRRFGLLVATPLDVLEELVACGALHCLLHERFGYWPLPGLERVSHLYRAALAE